MVSKSMQNWRNTYSIVGKPVKLNPKDVRCFGTRDFSEKSVICKKCSLQKRCRNVKHKKSRLNTYRRNSFTPINYDA